MNTFNDTPQQNFSHPPHTAEVAFENVPNNATIETIFDESTKILKWFVRDGNCHLHGYRRNRDEAAEFAQTLPAIARVELNRAER